MLAYVSLVLFGMCELGVGAVTLGCGAESGSGCVVNIGVMRLDTLGSDTTGSLVGEVNAGGVGTVVGGICSVGIGVARFSS